MPGTLKKEKITTANGSDLRQLEIQYNNLTRDVARIMAAFTESEVLAFYGVGPNSGTVPLKIASSDVTVGTAAMVFTILGVPVVKAVADAGTALGSLGTIPASTWGLIAIDVIAAGTVTYVSAAANYTTGYATEALAIAANPVRTTAKARVGHITIKASASTFVVGTDALAGGSSGNPATTTNYYPVAGVCAPTGFQYGPNGVVTAQQSLTAADAITSGNAWTGGYNGVLIPTVLSIGSNDYAVASSAFTYSCAGLTAIPKAAVTAGTAFTVTGAVPAGKWGVFPWYINGAGTITNMAGPSSFVTGYATEAAAIADLGNIFPAANLCQIGFITVQAQSALPWTAGTDALAGGTTGDQATTTNYYPTPGFTIGTGESASLLANRQRLVLAANQY